MMPIPVDASSRSTVNSVASVTSIICPSPAGLSDVSSSIDTAYDNEGIKMRCVRWVAKKFEVISEFFNEIYESLLSYFFGIEKSSVRLNKRIERGIEIIQRHFNGDVFNELDPNSFNRLHPHSSSVFVVIRYNDQRFRVTFGRLTEGREALKAKAIDLLRKSLRFHQHCEDGRLSIETSIFKANPIGNFDYHSIDSSIEFPCSVPPVCGWVQADNVTRLTVFNLLERSMPHHQDDPVSTTLSLARNFVFLDPY